VHLEVRTSRDKIWLGALGKRAWEGTAACCWTVLSLTEDQGFPTVTLPCLDLLPDFVMHLEASSPTLHFLGRQHKS